MVSVGAGKGAEEKGKERGKRRERERQMEKKDECRLPVKRRAMKGLYAPFAVVMSLLCCFSGRNVASLFHATCCLI